ncbi:MAG: spore germination protein [Clostridiales bacterium]|jgi:spore germination protein|nr:spore germination protein [Clostridiales bacterium]
MFSLNNKISIRQMQALLVLDIFGAGIVMLPRKAAKYAGQDAWLAIAAATAAAVLSVYLMTSAGRLYPRDSFVNLVSGLLSKPVGKFVGVLLSAKLLFNCAIELRLFGEILRQTMLPATPFAVVCAAMIAISAYAASKGYETRARIAQILFPLIFVPFTFLFVLGLFDVDLSNLLPVFATKPDKLLTGAIHAGTAFSGLELIMIAAPFAVRPYAVRRGMIQAVVFIGIFMIFITSVTIAKFGPGEVTRQLWPILDMMDLIDLPGAFIERQEALIMSFWIISNFAIVNSGLFFSSVLLKDVTGKGSHSLYILMCMPVVFAGSCFMLDVDQADHIIELVFYTLGIGFMIILPAVLLAAAALRKAGDARGKS